MRVQLWCLWCAPVAVIALFGGLVMADWIPWPSPSWSTQHVIDFYRHDTDLKRLGLTVLFLSGGLTGPLVVLISHHLGRIPGAELMERLQLISGSLGIVAIVLPALVYLIAAYRPERDPGVTVALHDAGSIFFIGNFIFALLQTVAIGVAILMQRGPTFVLPRWLGYVNLWCGLLFVPGIGAWMVKSGAFAWNGAVTFWIVATVFGAWFLVMFFALRQAIYQEAAEQ